MIYNTDMVAAIAVNGRFLNRRITGVERYAREVSARLVDQVHFLSTKGNLPGPAGHLWEQLILPRMLQGEVLWSPANTGPLAVSRQVLTLHDLSFIDHPEWFDRYFAAWYTYLIPRLAQRAALILTVSSFSKIRIMEAFRISPERVRVVPAGVDMDRFRPARAADVKAVQGKFNLHHPYLLAVGSLGMRKNLQRLLHAWGIVRGSFPDLDLVIVGTSGPAFRPVDLRDAPVGLHLLGWVDDAELAALYSGSAAYVLSSLYEGFGLPALEAMACGTPVVVSGVTALPEVVGGAGLLVDPWNSESIGQAICQVLEDNELRRGLIRRGFERARELSWDLTASGVWASIQSAAAYSD